MRALHRLVPWYGHIALKIAMSFIPLPYGLLRHFGVRRHGLMDEPEYAFRTAVSHLSPVIKRGTAGFRVLELGPGDSIAGGIVSYVFGAEESVLVDEGDFVVREVSAYTRLFNLLSQKGFDVARLRAAGDFEELLDQARITLLTRGISSLEQLRSHSIDVFFSQAVLEHVRAAEFSTLASETARLLRPYGYASHEIDFRDHIGGALNNLRYSERLWESRLFLRGGFYTNRFRLSDFLRRFESAGLWCEVTHTEAWDSVPMPRNALAPAFLHYNESELCIRVARVLLTLEEVHG